MINSISHFFRLAIIIGLASASANLYAMSFKMESIYNPDPDGWAEIQQGCRGQAPATQSELQKLLNTLNETGQPRYTQSELAIEKSKRPSCLLIRMWAAAAYVKIENNPEEMKKFKQNVPKDFYPTQLELNFARENIDSFE